MHQVEYFIELGSCDLKRRINEWLSRHPHITPISISINNNCHQAMLLYKEEE